MRRVLLILKKDFQRRLKSPWGILILMAIPVIMTAIFGAVFAPSSDGSNLPKIKLLVVDLDKEFGSKILISAFDAPELEDMFQLSLKEEAEAKQLMQKGKASALVIIPKGFTRDLFDGKTVTLDLVKNPSERFLPTIVEEFLNTMAVGVSAFVQVFDEEIDGVEEILDTPVETLAVAELVPHLEKSREKFVTLKEVLSPLLIKLKKEQKEKEEEENQQKFNIFSYFLPGLSFMFLLFIVETFMREIITEKEDGTLRRMWFSPIQPHQYIVAKLLSGWLMGLLTLILIILIGLVFFGIDWGNYLYLFPFSAITLFTVAGFFGMLNSFFKNKNQAGAFTSPIILIFAAFGGSFLPVEQLPAMFQAVSRFTLNYWFLGGVNMIKENSFPVLPAIVLVSAGMVFLAMSLILLPKRITQ